MSSKVAVVIPTLNEEENISTTLKAIKNQKTTFDYNIYICDGGSTDRTKELAKKYATVLESPTRGKSKQLNYAVKKIKADILCFIDGDTILGKNYLQKIYEFFASDQQLWACGALFKHSTEGLSFQQKLKIWFVNFHMPRFYDYHSLVGITKLPGCNLWIRRDIFLQIGGFKDIPNEDSVLSIELKELAKNKGYGRVRYTRLVKVLCSPRKILKYGAVGIFVYYIKRGITAEKTKRAS